MSKKINKKEGKLGLFGWIGIILIIVGCVIPLVLLSNTMNRGYLGYALEYVSPPIVLAGIGFILAGILKAMNK